MIFLFLLNVWTDLCMRSTSLSYTSSHYFEIKSLTMLPRLASNFWCSCLTPTNSWGYQQALGKGACCLTQQRMTYVMQLVWVWLEGAALTLHRYLPRQTKWYMFASQLWMHFYCGQSVFMTSMAQTDIKFIALRWEISWYPCLLGLDGEG